MSILKLLPPKKEAKAKPKRVLVQAKILTELREQAKVELKKDKNTIQQLIEASFRNYLEEKRQAHKRRG